MANRFEFVRDSLGEQKSGSEIEVIARRAQRAVGQRQDFLATRVAYKLGLRGPAITDVSRGKSQPSTWRWASR